MTDSLAFGLLSAALVAGPLLLDRLVGPDGVRPGNPLEVAFVATIATVFAAPVLALMTLVLVVADLWRHRSRWQVTLAALLAAAVVCVWLGFS